MQGSRLEDNSEKIGHFAPMQGRKLPRTSVQRAKTCLRLFRKAINKLNESFQTHNGRAIIDAECCRPSRSEWPFIIYPSIFSMYTKWRRDKARAIHGRFSLSTPATLLILQTGIRLKEKTVFDSFDKNDKFMASAQFNGNCSDGRVGD